MKPARTAQDATRQAQSSPAMKTLARAGFAMSGLLHLVLGWIVVRMAGSGSGDEDASQSGALAEIAAQPLGAVVLGVVAAGLLALAVWHLLTAVRESELTERVKAAGKAVVHVVLGVMAARFALGMGGGGADEESLTRTVMTYPMGRVAIAAVGLGILIAGVVHVVIGWKKSFQDDIRRSSKKEISAAVVAVGRVGYLAKGVALAVLGGLFITAALTADPEEAGGLDAAFAAIGAQPFGAVLLMITGAGIACFGLFCFARSRYESM